MLKEDNYALALSGAGVLLFRQTVLLQRLPSMWCPLSHDVMAVEIFVETFLHGVLLISLLIDPRWRFMLTFWLYFSYWLIVVEVLVAVVCFLSGLTGIAFLATTGLFPLFTWFNVYRYVEKDQKERDLQRAADRRKESRGRRAGRAAANNAQDEPVVLELDPTGLYLVAPSHSDPPVVHTPVWEQHLDMWRLMARTSNVICSGWVKLIANVLGEDAAKEADP